MNLRHINKDTNSSKSLSEMDIIKTYEQIADDLKEQTIEMALTDDQNKGKSRSHDGTRMTNHMNINETKSPSKNKKSIYFGDENHYTDSPMSFTERKDKP